jgi:hypothetical protein
MKDTLEMVVHVIAVQDYVNIVTILLKTVAPVAGRI